MDLANRQHRWARWALFLAAILVIHTIIVCVIATPAMRGALLVLALVPGWLVGGFLIVHPWCDILNRANIPFRQQPNMGLHGLLWPISALIVFFAFPRHDDIQETP